MGDGRYANEHWDSAGRPIRIGDKIRFRGLIFTLAGFGPKVPPFDAPSLLFEEPVMHTDEVPHECNCDIHIP